MSSIINMASCEICNQKKLPTYFCIDCDTIFCLLCWREARVHAPGKVNRDGIPHEMLPDKATISRLKQIFTPANDPTQQLKLHKSDAGSKWFGVINHDGAPTLHDYARYTSIMRESARGVSKRWPQLVSFVGQTAAGKSTLIKALVDYQARGKNLPDYEFPSPVAGSINTHSPTSGDVHLYSDPGSYHSKFPLLYADCEGMDGGEKIPIGAQQARATDHSIWNVKASTSSSTIPTASTDVKPTKLQSNKIPNKDKGGRRYLKWANNAEKCKREFAVKNLYPRILYAFSDIVVFVLRNDRTFETAALLPLLQWADTSVESSVNQSAMPHVIIVLNCSDPEIEQQQWTVKSATDSLLNTYANAVIENSDAKDLSKFWQERGKTIKTTKDLLQCYYASVTVIRVPQKGRYGHVDDQIAELSLQIQRKCEEARENRKRFRVSFNAEEFQQALSIGFDHFSNRLDEPLDFVQISCMSNPIPEDFGGNILRLALAMKDDPRMAGKTGRDIFRLLGSMVASCIMLDYVRHDIKGTPSRLLLHYKESYGRALKNFCALFWPCTFTLRGMRCVNTQRGHIRGHQDMYGKFIYDGPYESADNFTEQNFEVEWHKMLEYNLDHTRYRLSKMMRGEIAMDEQLAAEELHLERINKFYSNLSAVSNYANHAACFCCLREFPIHALQCGHVLCTSCVKSFAHKKNTVTYGMEWCPLHKHEKWDQEWEIPVKPDLAGVRILTLDGGGIRGMVELMVLAEIQGHLGRIPVARFFDLIIGTSTGGILAVGLGVQNWTVLECIRKFGALCSKAFTPRFAPIVQQLSSVVLRITKYQTKPFEEVLKEHFGENQMFGGKCDEQRYQRKVAVVSTYDAVQSPVILANYNRPQRKEEPDYKFERPDAGRFEIKTWEACRATSAAPTFFKPFVNRRTGRSYIDGALYYNNPARVAHQERKLLWPEIENIPPDIMLSIGSGCEPKGKTEKPVRPTYNRTYQVAVRRFDNLLDAQNAWEQYEQEVRQPNEDKNSRFIRLNPEINPKAKLDELGSMETLKRNVKQVLRSTKSMIETRDLARRLIASSFFFERSTTVNVKNEIHGWIYSRFPDESNDLRHLGSLLQQHQSKTFSPFFIVSEEDEGQGSLHALPKEIIASMIHESTFKLGPFAIRPSSTLARTTISLCLLKNGECYPISGFPRYFFGNKSENRNFTAKGMPGQEMGQDLRNETHGEDSNSERNSLTNVTSNSSSTDLSSPLWSNSDTPLYSPGEDMPFWARGFKRSIPTPVDDFVESSAMSSTETIDRSHNATYSPLQSANSVSERRTSTGANNKSADITSETEVVTALGSQVPRTSTRPKLRARDASPTLNLEGRIDVRSLDRSFENSSSYAAFVLDTPITSKPTVQIPDEDPQANAVIQDMAEEEMIELARERSSTPLTFGLNTEARTGSSASSTIYPHRPKTESGPLGNLPSLYHALSSPDIVSKELLSPDPQTGRWQSPTGIDENQTVIAGITEDEAIQVAKMRSMKSL